MNEELRFRLPSTSEMQILQRLLEVDFPGRQAVVSQVHGIRVRRIDPEGSLELKAIPNSEEANVERRIPVEAEGMDEDGTMIHVLLHVVNGIASELEIYKDDGSSIKAFPSPQNLKLLVL
jgi:hypothetical protein